MTEAFIEKLTEYCERIASLPAMMGRPRPELRPRYRSITFGNYVIFLQYADNEGPRSHLYVCNVIQGNRDLDAYFADYQDEEDA